MACCGGPQKNKATAAAPAPAPAPAAAKADPASLWARMGEEAVIRPMCNDLYDLHASDPVTADWFPPASTWNTRTAAEVKENVFTFFSSGIGGPHEYKGQDMVAAHEKMAKQMPITEAAFHALTYHVLDKMTAHSSGGAKEMEEVLAILMSLKPDVTKFGLKKFDAIPEGGASLYTRMGEEAVIRPMCNELYELHASDPITAPWFPPSATWNTRTAAEVKENVFTFFSSGIGGPHEYKGQDMVAAHAKIREKKPITEAAFHALSYHVLEKMTEHETGGDGEKEEVLAILMSLKGDITKFGMKTWPKAKGSLYDRMGAEAVIRPMCNELYDYHASDPITAPWFHPASEWNQRTADEVKENVFTFFSSGIGGPHEYKGQDMVAAHAKMRDMKPLSESAFHALVFHVMSMMKKHESGGEQEMDEVWGILMSLKSAVMEGK